MCSVLFDIDTTELLYAYGDEDKQLYRDSVMRAFERSMSVPNLVGVKINSFNITIGKGTSASACASFDVDWRTLDAASEIVFEFTADTPDSDKVFEAFRPLENQGVKIHEIKEMEAI